jgi:hypothetical protein
METSAICKSIIQMFYFFFILDIPVGIYMQKYILLILMGWN